MANTPTINKILSIFKDFSIRCELINGYSVGSRDELDAIVDKRYPYMHTEVGSSTIQSGNSNFYNSEVYRFKIFFLDRLDKGGNNAQQIISDTKYISSMFIGELCNHQYYIDNDMLLTGDVNGQVFYDETTDHCNGWMLDISIKVPMRFTPCNSPITPITGYTVSTANNITEYRLIGATGAVGATGATGISVIGASVSNGDLYVYLSDGNILNTGYVIGATGATGNTGTFNFDSGTISGNFTIGGTLSSCVGISSNLLTACSGGSELNLKAYGVDGALLLSSDNGSWTSESQLYLDSVYAELSNYSTNGQLFLGAGFASGQAKCKLDLNGGNNTILLANFGGTERVELSTLGAILRGDLSSEIRTANYHVKVNNTGNIELIGTTASVLSVLDMSGNKIVNLATGSNPLDAVNVIQLNTATTSMYDDFTTKNIPFNIQTASYSLVLSDNNKMIEGNTSSTILISIPEYTSQSFATGSQILISRIGTGTMSITSSTNVSILSAGGKLNLASQYSVATLINRGIDSWIFSGDISS